VRTPDTYLEEVNQYLIHHPHVVGFRFVKEHIKENSTYIRVRVVLLDGSSLHFTEYSETDIDGYL
jgi:hypothetical protein